MNKKWATLGVTLGVLGGGAAGFIATAGGSSVGAEVATRAVVPQADTGSTDTTVAGSGSGSGPFSPDSGTRPDRGDRLAEVLAPLVEDGTITQAQADAVIAALEAAGPFGGDHDGDGGMGRGPVGGGFGAKLDEIASVLGLSVDEIAGQLRDGKTIAEIAEAQGVDVQKVIDAAVAAVKEHLDEEVASGEHTQAEADEILATATDAITQLVNGELPDGPWGGMGGMGGPMGRGGHHGGPFGDHDGDGGAPADAPTTTTLG